MSLAAGKLKHRVRFDRREAMLDTAGDPIRGPQGETQLHWVEVCTVWAGFDPLSVREFVQSASKQSEVTARFTIRTRDDLDATCRAYHRGKYYNVEGALPDKDSGLEYLSLPVSEGVSDGQ